MIDPLNPGADPRVQKGIEAFTRDALKIRNKRKTYYNENSAIWVRGLLDDLHKSGIPLKVVRETNGALRINTLRLRYYQGIEYLRDNLDPDDTYKRLSKATKCTVYRDYLELHIRNIEVAHTAPALDWKPLFEEFLENAELGQKFNPKVLLTLPEVRWINEQLFPLSRQFIYNITPDEFLVIRFDTEEEGG